MHTTFKTWRKLGTYYIQLVTYLYICKYTDKSSISVIHLDILITLSKKMQHIRRSENNSVDLAA